MPRFRTTLQFFGDHRLRGLHGGPWDNYDFSHLFLYQWIIVESLNPTKIAKVNGGQRWNRTTDTGIFRLIGLPCRFDKSHGYRALAKKVWMGDCGIVEIYTRSTSFFDDPNECSMTAWPG